MTVGAGRYAPSPSGRLHIGNLRTALIAWAWARTSGRSFLLRNEDIDPHRTGAAEEQMKELAWLGIDWDGPILNQSERFHIYDELLESLQRRGLVFECYCSRKDISEATRAPHSPPGHYPGTCANLDNSARVAARERLAKQGRGPALRLRSPGAHWQVEDMLRGTYSGPVDSFVLRRGDGTPAYNLAVVVDDALSGVDQVVRGDDLLEAAPGQAYLADALGFDQPVYGHVPLVLGPTGKRLAKRDGAVTWEELRELGWSGERIMSEITGSLGISPVGTANEFLSKFDPALLPRTPQIFTAELGLKPGPGF